MSIRNKIIQAVDYDSELYEVPEWGVTIKLRSMMAGERNRISIKHMNEKGDITDYAGLAMEVLVASMFEPETDQPIFTFDDIEELNKKSGKVIDGLVMAAMKLNGFGQDAVKEAEKNS